MVMLIQLKEPLGAYHQRCADVHGWLYIVDEPGKRLPPRPVGGDSGVGRMRRDLIEARSLATGVVCTFRPECVEVANALQEPEGPQLQA
jgi:hypothetical protein